MFKVLLVVFREVLEITLFIGVIAAATRHISSRYYILLGVVLGGLSSLVLALLISRLSLIFGGLGEEIFSVFIMFLTVFMILYTAIWINNTKAKSSVKKVVESINMGQVSKAMIVLIVAMTVLREGAEIILLLHGIILSGSVNSTSYIAGFILGTLGATLVGVSIYNGLVTISPKYFFKISSIVLAFIAAGIAAEAVGILTSSGLVLVGTDKIVDPLHLTNTVIINLFKILAGYSAIPNIAQTVSYVLTLLVFIFVSYCLPSQKNIKHQKLGR